MPGHVVAPYDQPGEPMGCQQTMDRVRHCKIEMCGHDVMGHDDIVRSEGAFQAVFKRRADGLELGGVSSRSRESWIRRYSGFSESISAMIVTDTSPDRVSEVLRPATMRVS
jgi:hypothetical protein